MFRTIYDSSKNRVTVHYEGHFDAAQGNQLVKDLRKLLSRCQKGFQLLVVMSSLEKMDLEARPYIDQAMDLINQYGVTKIVRVISDPEKDIGFSIMSLFHYPKDVQIMTCGSLAEAESHLD